MDKHSGMDSVDPKSLYERRWQNAIEKGLEQAGNLELNLSFLEQAALLKPGQKVLELGCGVGLLTDALHQKGLDILGTDISEHAVAYARSKYPSIRFEAVDAESLPFDDRAFDAVLSFDVLEHLHDVDRHLDEVVRVLKPNGYYLFQTPNKWTNSLFETLKTRSFYWRTYHPSLHSCGRLKRRLTAHGFVPRFVKMNTMNRHTLDKIGKIGLPPALFGWIDFRRLPLRLQTNFYVIAHKRTEAAQ